MDRSGSQHEPAPAGEQRTTSGGDRNLPLAVASGVLLAGLLVGTVLWHPAAWATLVAVVALVGVLETARVSRDNGAPVATPPVVVALFVTIAGAYQAAHAGQGVGVVTLFVGAILWELADVERRDVFRKVAGTLLIGLWIPFLASFAILLNRSQPDAWVATLATVGVAVLNDVGAYVVGRRFGQRKLAPALSPGKTWEGAVGGLAVTVIVAVVVLPLLGGANLFDPVSAFVFALVVVAAGVLGDLTESMLKRDLGVKDFGGLIPGHGGVLDRMDSLLFAFPAGYFSLVLITR